MNNVPDGWKLVPICPTREMRAAAGREESKYVAARATYFAGDSWVAMVEAAPEYVSEAWNGEGLPPVGTVCEYRVGNGTWFPCTIRYVTTPISDEEVQVIIHCPHLNGDQICGVGSGIGDINFRLIRKPEQIAADLREKAAEELYLAINWNDTPSTWANLSQSRRADYFKAIDSGWNKFEIIDEPKS